MSDQPANWPEKLNAYLDDELPGAERRELEARLAEDALLMQELERLKLARKAVQQYGIKQTVGRVHNIMMKELEVPVGRMHPPKYIRSIFLIAAVILVAVAGINLYRDFTLTNTDLFNQQFNSYELSTTRDGNESNSQTEILYRQKKFREVTLVNDTSGVRNLFLSGMAALELRNAPLAITKFNQLLRINNASGTKEFNDETEYYLALAFLLNRDYELSSVLMEQIRANPAHTYHEKLSRKMIRKVNRLK